MVALNIPDLPEEVHLRLQRRAARTGRSLEAEARDILAAACAREEPSTVTAKDLQELVNRLYGGRKPTGVVDELIAERRREAAAE